LANDDDYVALKRTDKDREGWRHEKGCQKPAVQQKIDDDDVDDDDDDDDVFSALCTAYLDVTLFLQ